MKKQLTAMQELLAQLKEERNNLPMPKEWANCLKSIEIVIEKHYLEKERQQIIKSVNTFSMGSSEVVQIVLKKYNLLNTGETYYKNNYEQNT